MNPFRPLQAKGLDRCAWSYLADARRRRPPRAGDPVHLLLCLADHYEPKWNGADQALADRRVADWVENYPRLLGRFRDRDGRPPRHSFFFPIEEYEPNHLDGLAGLCRDGFGEVEIHLHHDDDTSANLRKTLIEYRDLFDRRHGLLGRDRTTGDLSYGFIHGNWALDNSRPDGRRCGVNDELTILRETGCYADFTMPSAPGPCQTPTINRIYRAVDDPDRPRSHDRGVEVGHGPASPGTLMLIQGPLLLNWTRKKWGVFPRLENGCIQGNQAPSLSRLDLWLRARVQVPTRPDWFFVKLHTHGTQEKIRQVILGEAMVSFHRGLQERMASDPRFHVHYVTARELFNLARAAEDGWIGSVDKARDYQILPPAAAVGQHPR